MTSEDEQRIRRIEQELLPDATMFGLIERDTAYLTGKTDGQAGRINEALVLDPARSEAYRRGLQVGRTAQVDAELLRVAACPVCNGTGTERVGDDLEYEVFECRACDSTGLAGGRTTG